MMNTKPLAKALHTVTVAARVAMLLAGLAPFAGMDARALTLAALESLGYSAAQCEANPELLAACVAAVAKATRAPVALAVAA